MSPVDALPAESTLGSAARPSNSFKPRSGSQVQVPRASSLRLAKGRRGIGATGINDEDEEAEDEQEEEDENDRKDYGRAGTKDGKGIAVEDDRSGGPLQPDQSDHVDA